MSVDLADYVESLRREISPPGSTSFATVSDATLLGSLADAFWVARLDGLLAPWEADEDGVITPVDSRDSDIGRADIALIVLYAGIQILRNKVLEMGTKMRVKAGPVEFETQNSANVLTEMLQQLNTVRARLIAKSEPTVGTMLIDGYTVRQVCDGSYGGWLSDTLLGIGS